MTTVPQQLQQWPFWTDSKCTEFNIEVGWFLEILRDDRKIASAAARNSENGQYDQTFWTFFEKFIFQLP